MRQHHAVRNPRPLRRPRLDHEKKIEKLQSQNPTRTDLQELTIEGMRIQRSPESRNPPNKRAGTNPKDPED